MPKHYTDALMHERTLLLELQRLIKGRLDDIDRQLSQAGSELADTGELAFLRGATDEYASVTIVEAMRRELELSGTSLSGPALALGLLAKGARTLSKDRRSFTSSIHVQARQRPDVFVRIGRNWDLVSRHQKPAPNARRRTG